MVPTLASSTFLAALALSALVASQALAAAPDPVAPTPPIISPSPEPAAPGEATPVETPRPVDGPMPIDAPVPTEPPAAVTTPGSGEADAPFAVLTLRGGVGNALEADRDDVPYAAAGLGLDLDLGSGLGLGLGYQYRVLRPTYSVRGPVVRGVASFAVERPLEHWMDLRLGLSYNLLETATDAVSWSLALGPRFVQVLAEGFDRWAFSPEVQTRLAIPISDRVSVDAGYAFGFVVAGPDTTASVLGVVDYLHDWDAGFAVELDDAGRFALELRYEGHLVVYELVERAHHALMGGIRFAF